MAPGLKFSNIIGINDMSRREYLYLKQGGLVVGIMTRGNLRITLVKKDPPEEDILAQVELTHYMGRVNVEPTVNYTVDENVAIPTQDVPSIKGYTLVGGVLRFALASN